MKDQIATLKINKASQTTIPKALREILGVEIGDSLAVRRTSRKNEVVIVREPSLEEKLSKIRSGFSAETKERIKQNRGKTVRELREAWDNSTAGKNYYKEKYSIGR